MRKVWKLVTCVTVVILFMGGLILTVACNGGLDDVDNDGIVPDGTEDQNGKSVWDGKYPDDVVQAKEWMGDPIVFGPYGCDCVFEINSAKQLAALYVLVSKQVIIPNTITGGDGKYKYANYKINVDIDLNNKDWKPITTIGTTTPGGYLHLDGQGHTISGLNISSDTRGYVGLLGEGESVKNLIVQGLINLHNSEAKYVGGIMGRTNGGGYMSFCAFEGTITIDNLNSDVFLGGLVGFFGNSIYTTKACFTNVNLNLSKAFEQTHVGSLFGDFATSGAVNADKFQLVGCTWLYDRINNEGYENGLNISRINTDQRIEDNFHYSTIVELEERVKKMNSYATEEDEYRWVIDGCSLMLQKSDRGGK